jgi:uncharacterized protein YjdB
MNMKIRLPLLVAVAAVGAAAACSANDSPTTSNGTVVVCVTTITVSPATITLHVGDTTRFVAKGCATESTSWRWRVSNASIATVDSITGFLRATKGGSASVIATAVSDPTVMGAAALTVVP